MGSQRGTAAQLLSPLAEAGVEQSLAGITQPEGLPLSTPAADPSEQSQPPSHAPGDAGAATVEPPPARSTADAADAMSVVSFFGGSGFGDRALRSLGFEARSRSSPLHRPISDVVLQLKLVVEKNPNSSRLYATHFPGVPVISDGA